MKYPTDVLATLICESGHRIPVTWVGGSDWDFCQGCEQEISDNEIAAFASGDNSVEDPDPYRSEASRMRGLRIVGQDGNFAPPRGTYDQRWL